MNSITKKRIADYIFEYTKLKNVNLNGTTNIGGVLMEHYIRNVDLKRFDFIYSTYNKDGKRNNDYQTFSMSFEQFNKIIINNE